MPITEWNDKELMEMVRMAVSESVKDSCELVTKYCKNSMKRGSYKEYYSKRGDGSKHWSAHPGNAPAPDIGLLKGSISYQTNDGKSGGISAPASQQDGVKAPPKLYNQWKIVGVIGSNVKYAEFLETGTSVIAPRPYLRPALAKNLANIYKIFIENGNKYIK